jgi:hypothetical protein
MADSIRCSACLAEVLGGSAWCSACHGLVRISCLSLMIGRLFYCFFKVISWCVHPEALSERLEGKL